MKGFVDDVESMLKTVTLSIKSDIRRISEGIDILKIQMTVGKGRFGLSAMDSLHPWNVVEIVHSRLHGNLRLGAKKGRLSQTEKKKQITLSDSLADNSYWEDIENLILSPLLHFCYPAFQITVNPKKKIYLKCKIRYVSNVIESDNLLEEQGISL